MLSVCRVVHHPRSQQWPRNVTHCPCLHLPEGRYSGTPSSQELLGPNQQIRLLLGLLFAKFHKSSLLVTQELCKAERSRHAMYLIQSHKCKSAIMLRSAISPCTGHGLTCTSTSVVHCSPTEGFLAVHLIISACLRPPYRLPPCAT